MNEFKNLAQKMNRLTIFRDLLKNDIVSDMIKLLENIDCENCRKQLCFDYCGIVSRLYKEDTNWSDFCKRLMLEDENVYLHSIIRGEKNRCFEECIADELWTLSKFAGIDCKDICEKIDSKGFLPPFESRQCDFSSVYADRCHNIDKYGYGIYARAHVFTLKNERLAPVESHDDIRLSDLLGYEVMRNEIVRNTKALLSGLPANNVLLYGDCGTGKSSTVKAIANEFAPQGLRLIELKKKQLHELGLVVREISKNPLKFIIFIDDLSFSEDDDDYAALKAALEGSVSSTANNMVIYATSNRRHLIKESFKAREGDEIHRGDTIQETISLSERFGLQIRFMKPDKAQFLEVVHSFAKQFKINMPYEELDRQAESFALSRGGRSPRLAKQFAEYIKSCET